MKRAVDVKKHQSVEMINFASSASKGNQVKKKYEHCSLGLMVTAESVKSYNCNRDIDSIIKLLSRNSTEFDTSIINANIIYLSGLLINELGSRKFTANCSGSLCEEFYESCLESMIESNLLEISEDPELVVIYLKQLMEIFRASGLMSLKNGFYYMQQSVLSQKSFYEEIFTAFWEKTSWVNIFPSMPDAAKAIHSNRSLLAELLTTDDIITLTDFCNSFVQKSGYGKLNDIYFISFVDFYLFTWLRHFNMLEYLPVKSNSVVAVRLTPLGKAFIQKLK